MNFLKKIFKDPAFLALIAFNIIVILQYRNDKQYYTTVVWLFWLQSVVIGVFNFFDMLTLQRVETGNLTINEKAASPREAKGCLSFFFLIHYGLFHLAYLVFLFIDFKFTDVNFSILKWGFYGLLLSSIIQLIQNKTIYRQVPRNITKMFFMPYLRIIPMHLTILLPKFLHWQPGLTFLVLKFIIDILSYIFTTPYYKEDPSTEPGGFV